MQMIKCGAVLNAHFIYGMWSSIWSPYFVIIRVVEAVLSSPNDAKTDLDIETIIAEKNTKHNNKTTRKTEQKRMECIKPFEKNANKNAKHFTISLVN